MILVFVFCSFSAQKSLPLDTLKLKEAKDMLADDYGNLYVYKNKDFSLTKYDSLGKQIGQMMLTVPFKVQSVQNPLSVPLFSENAQELKFVDQNMNEIQRVDFKQNSGLLKWPMRKTFSSSGCWMKVPKGSSSTISEMKPLLILILLMRVSMILWIFWCMRIRFTY